MPNLKNISEYLYLGHLSYWGNGYLLHGRSDRLEERRTEMVQKHRPDFSGRLSMPSDGDRVLNEMPSRMMKEWMGKRQGCFCKPRACHGDVLVDYLNRSDDGRQPTDRSVAILHIYCRRAGSENMKITGNTLRHSGRREG